MTRKKIELKWIESDSARRASLRKRREGLLKKVNELTTLCGIEACAVIVTPGDDQPMHWPPTREGVEEVMGRFFGLPEMEQMRKMTTLESYLSEKNAKLQEKIMKQERKMKEMEVNQLMHQIYSHGRRVEELDLMERNGLSWFMGEKAKEVKRRIQFLKQTAPGMSGVDEVGHIGGHGVVDAARAPTEGFMSNQWLMGTLNPNENIGSSSGGGGHNMGAPYWNIGSSPSGGNDMGLPQGNFGGSSGGGGGNIPGVSHWNIGSSSSGGNDMGLPQGNIGGSSSGGGNDVGPSYEIPKSWPYNFSD